MAPYLRYPLAGLLAFLVLVPFAHSFGAGRVVVAGTEFFWYDADLNILRPFRFVGYSDYDLLTAVPVNRTGCLGLDEPQANPPPPDPPNPPIVSDGLLVDVLNRLSAVGGNPQNANLLRIWAMGKHNARDWHRLGGNGFDFDEVRNEHDNPAFARSNANTTTSVLKITDPLDADYRRRLRLLCELANERDIVVMITLFDDITLKNNGGGNRYNWSTSPWFWKNQVANFMQDALPEDPEAPVTCPAGCNSQCEPVETCPPQCVPPCVDQADLDRRDAFPNWYGVGVTEGLDRLLEGQLTQFVKKIVDEVRPYNNVIFEIMNEPELKGGMIQRNIMFWHELVGLYIHALDPMRVVVANVSMFPDLCDNPTLQNCNCALPLGDLSQGGTFRLGFSSTCKLYFMGNGCTEFCGPMAPDGWVIDSEDKATGASGHALMDIPDLDAISLHYGQWSRSTYLTYPFDITADKMAKVLSRDVNAVPTRFYRANIKPLIVDTDAAKTDELAVPLNCPGCGDKRVSENNDRMFSWGERSLAQGASFNTKDGIGTTDRTAGDQCLVGDATMPLTPANIDSRIDTTALSRLHMLITTQINTDHDPDLAAVEIRYNDACPSNPNPAIRCYDDACPSSSGIGCIATFEPSRGVSILGSVRRNSSRSDGTLRVQYRWLIQDQANPPQEDEIIEPYPPGTPVWQNMLDATTGQPVTYQLDEGASVVDVRWVTAAPPSQIASMVVLVLEVRVTTEQASDPYHWYDRDQVVAWNQAAIPSSPASGGPNPSQLFAALAPPLEGFGPVIDPGSLEATVNGVSATLSWVVIDPDSQPSINVHLGVENPPEAMVAGGLHASTLSFEGLTLGETYYWWISAADTNGHSDESPIRSFTMPNAAPNTVVLDDPAENDDDVAPTTSFTWHVENGEPGLTYTVFLGVCPGAGSCTQAPPAVEPLDNCTDITTTSCDPSPKPNECPPDQLDPETWYYYRVDARPPNGPTTSEDASFGTGVDQGGNGIVLEGSSAVLMDPTDWCFGWREDPKCTQATTWICARPVGTGIWTCDEDSAGSCTCGGCSGTGILNEPWLGAGPQSPPPLETDTTYQWAIAVTKSPFCNPDTPGCTEDVWTETQYFTTRGPDLSDFHLTAPADNTSMVVLEGDTIQFTWTASAATPPSAPVTYRLEIRRNSQLVATYSGLQTTTKTISASILAENGSYTWRVLAMAGSTTKLNTCGMMLCSFTLNITHTDKWLVVTPGPVVGVGANRASIFYKPATGNLQLLRQFYIEEPPPSSGELLPAVGDLDLTRPGNELVFGTGSSNRVYLYGTEGGAYLRIFRVFTAQENPSGKVHVAVGDVDSSNPGNEIVVGTGTEYSSEDPQPVPSFVKVFSSTGSMLSSFSPTGWFNPSGVVWVAAGELLSNLPGEEIVCGPGPRSNLQLLIYNHGVKVGTISSPVTPIQPDPHNVTVAVGDFSPTNAGSEILASTLGGGEMYLFSHGGTPLQSYSVFNLLLNPSGNVSVTAGLIDNMPDHEILVGTGYQGQAYLAVLKSNGSTVILQQILPPGMHGGEVHVAGNR